MPTHSVRHVAITYLPGSFFPEEATLDVPRRPDGSDPEPADALEMILKAAERNSAYRRVFCFEFRRVVEVNVAAEVTAYAEATGLRLPPGLGAVLRGHEKVGARYYMPGTQVFTGARLRELDEHGGAIRNPLTGEQDQVEPGSLSTLVSNLSSWDSDQMLLCVAGNWQPRAEGDVVYGEVKAGGA